MHIGSFLPKRQHEDDLKPSTGQISANESSETFRYSSLESDPVKEFEHSKWIVLTTSQPFLDEDSAAEKNKLEK